MTPYTLLTMADGTIRDLERGITFPAGTKMEDAAEAIKNGLIPAVTQINIQPTNLAKEKSNA